MTTWAPFHHRLIDSHCHLHHYTNPEQLIIRCGKKRMRVLVMTVRPDEFPNCRQQLADWPSLIPCLGLYPLYLDTISRQLADFHRWLPESRYIGEVGLDYTAEEKQRRNQRRVLTKLLDMATDIHPHPVVSLHSRRAAEDTLHAVRDSPGTAIMHWFSGSPNLVENAPEHIFFSINTAMLRSRNGKDILAALSPRQVLTETDGPYVNHAGQPATPFDLSVVIDSLAHRWQRTREQVLSIIESNFFRAVGEN